MEPVLKVGDRVRLRNSGGFDHPACYAGSEGTVKRINRLSRSCIVVLDEDEKEQDFVFLTNEFERIEDVRSAPVEHHMMHPAEDAFDVNAALGSLFDDMLEEDIVVRPSHYTQYAIEPITFIMRNGLPFWKGNIIKYASRAGSKLYEGMDERESEITDLKKAIRYAEMRINQLEGEEIL
jgi:hypothetical protein